MEEKVVEVKQCKNCGIDFDITDKDLEFYDKVLPVFNWIKYNIPTPTFCPTCRLQRKMSFRNERKLYKRSCDWTWKPIVSMIHPNSEYKVYDSLYRACDKWNAMSFWISYNFDKWFFEQINEIMKNVPLKHLIQFFENDNSHYCNYVWSLKNCYLEHWSVNCENCYYWYENLDWKDLIDCQSTINCSLCYEVAFSKNIHNSKYICFSEYIENSNFIYNCSNLKDCFGCVNLNNKQYCVFNEQYTKEGYLNFMSEINLWNYLEFLEYKSKFNEFHIRFPRKNLILSNTENTLGDYVSNCKNSSFVFNMMLDENENLKYCYKSGNIKDCMDLLNSAFNITNSFDGYNYISNVSQTLFWFHIENSTNILYSCFINNCKNCFWCIWLTNKEYCILNKQYTQEEYEQLVPKIIEQMRNNLERWEFFPSSISPFGYNETIAQEYFQITKDEAINKGYKRQDIEIPINIPTSLKLTTISEIPNDIKEISNNILNEAIVCEISWKPFRIIESELTFYKKYNIPLPRLHPDIRHLNRIKLKNPMLIFNRECNKCGINMKTTYSPERPEIVYCESCYNKEVYW